MRAMNFALPFLVGTIILALGSFAYAESVGQQDISFSVPYDCSNQEDGKDARGKTLCLADAFPPGLDVVLVSTKGICSAKTADAFTDPNPPGNEFEATHLTGTENCFVEQNRNQGFVAIVGVDASSVRVVESKNDKSSMSKGAELKARMLARSRYKDLKPTASVANVAKSPPDVFSVGTTVFLLFKCTEEFFNQDGLPVLVLNNRAFLLPGMCAFNSPFFFTVDNKLYVSYWATESCCGCGDSSFSVLDLSGKEPKLAYGNSNFSY